MTRFKMSIERNKVRFLSFEVQNARLKLEEQTCSLQCHLRLFFTRASALENTQPPLGWVDFWHQTILEVWLQTIFSVALYRPTGQVSGITVSMKDSPKHIILSIKSGIKGDLITIKSYVIKPHTELISTNYKVINALESCL